jgi:hypothetical protein
MPCLLGCLALAMPRLVLILVWLTSDYLHRAYATVIWPVLGFFLLPTTTLAYAFAMNFGGHAWTPVGVAAVVVGFLLDLGFFKTGSNARKRKREQAG